MCHCFGCHLMPYNQFWVILHLSSFCMLPCRCNRQVFNSFPDLCLLMMSAVGYMLPVRALRPLNFNCFIPFFGGLRWCSLNSDINNGELQIRMSVLDDGRQCRHIETLCGGAAC